MTVFEQVKSAVDMKTVAEGYGLHIDRGGMCICPFHEERTPSAKIYPDALHCFGCGAHVDVIGFTQKMFGLDKPIDAVKKLNDDYGLHIDIGKAPSAKEVSEYQKRVQEKHGRVGKHRLTAFRRQVCADLSGNRTYLFPSIRLCYK